MTEYFMSPHNYTAGSLTSSC